MKEQPAYYAIIPASVRYADIIPNAKLLYGELTALANKDGYCWASNQYFADLYKVNKTTISEWIRILIEKGFISSEVLNNTDRKIYIAPSGKAEGGFRKSRRGASGKAEHNNTVNNTSNTSEQSSAVEFQIVPDLEVKTKAPSRAKDIEAVFRLFNNPAWQTWKVRPLERKAAEVLFDTHGLEVLKRRLARIDTEKKKGDPYFPEVNTPSQLLDKMPNIERYLTV